MNKYYPENTGYILNAYLKSHNLDEARRMVEAVNLHMQENADYLKEISQFGNSKEKKRPNANKGSVFDWMNIAEWQDFKIAVAKDKALIDSAAYLTGV